jgi:hypothetical protein
MTDRSGPAPVRVSRFRRLDSTKAMPTNDTSGPLFTHSSPSAALQLSLENRLREQTDVNGSVLFALTWKQQDMPSGPPICALRARAHRTSGNGFTGWPTPNHNTTGPGHQGRHGGLNLQTAVQVAPWPPTAHRVAATDGCSQASEPISPSHASTVMQLASWPTPTKGNADGSQMAKDASPTGRRPEGSKATVSLNQVAQTAGSGSSAQTAKPGRLNPAFSLWLMLGPLATVWLSCAPPATRSTSTRRGSSSGQPKISVDNPTGG